MHILFLTARYAPDVIGGGEVSTKLIAEALAAAGETITVLTAGAEEKDETIGGVRILRLPTLQLWRKKPLHEASLNRRGATLLTDILQRYELRPDIIHAHEFRSAMTLAHLNHPHRVVTIRDYAPICGSTNNMWWDGSTCDGCTLFNVLLRNHRVAEASLLRKPFRAIQYKGNIRTRLRSFQAIPHHIYTSQVLADRIAERLPLPSSVTRTVIPNPVDPAWVDAPRIPPPNDPVIYGFGRLEHTKGPDILFHAVQQLVPEFPNLQVHVGGGEVERYRALARKLGIEKHITFHGSVPGEKVRALIDGSQVVVASHRWEEPFGRAALEAGIRGRPLITSDRGGVKETTTEETAVRVDTTTPEAFAHALRALLRDRAGAISMGAAAREYIATRFRASSVTTAHQNLYRKIF